MSYKPPVEFDNQERSGPARRVEAILNDMDISFTPEQEFPPYKVDIYITEFHVALEIDGPFHTKAKDKTRDRYLEKFYALPVKRMNSTRWQQKGRIKDNIIKFIEEHADTATERKAVWLGRSGS